MSQVLIMVARGRIKAPKYLGVFKSVNPPGVPADLKSAVKKGSTYKHRGICNPPIKGKAYSFAADCKSAEPK